MVGSQLVLIRACSSTQLLLMLTGYASLILLMLYGVRDFPLMSMCQIGLLLFNCAMLVVRL
jgi:hypothetical protein